MCCVLLPSHSFLYYRVALKRLKHHEKWGDWYEDKDWLKPSRLERRGLLPLVCCVIPGRSNRWSKSPTQPHCRLCLVVGVNHPNGWMVCLSLWLCYYFICCIGYFWFIYQGSVSIISPELNTEAITCHLQRIPINYYYSISYWCLSCLKWVIWFCELVPSLFHTYTA